MESDRQDRIRDRAYHIWVGENRPDGRHDEHWRRAEREIAVEETSRPPSPAVERPRGRSTALTREKAPPAAPERSPPKSASAVPAPKPPARTARAVSGRTSGLRNRRRSLADDPAC
jgi:hypothetical protein